MKKGTRNVVMGAMVLNLLMGTALTAYAFNKWIGAEEVVEINDKLDKVEVLVKQLDEKETFTNELQVEVDTLQKQVVELEQEIKEQDITIEDNHKYMHIYYNDNERLNKEIVRLTDIIKQLQEDKSIGQALEDVQAINTRLETILKGK